MTEADVFEAQYLSRLRLFAAKWQVKYPDEAKAIRAQIAAEWKTAGHSEPEPGSLRWHVFEEAVVEAIRVKAGKPTARQFMLEEGFGIPAPQKLPAPVSSAVERHDAKALAANDG